MAVNQRSPAVPCFIDTVGCGCGSDSGDDSHGTCNPWPSPRQRRPYRSHCRNDGDGEGAFCPGLVSIHQSLHLRRTCFQQSRRRTHPIPLPPRPPTRPVPAARPRNAGDGPPRQNAATIAAAAPKRIRTIGKWTTAGCRGSGIRFIMHLVRDCIGGCADVNRYATYWLTDSRQLGQLRSGSLVVV